MKVIRKDTNDYRVINDDGETSKTCRLTTDRYVKLTPECYETTNRKMISCQLVDDAPDQTLELTVKEYHEPRVLGARTSGQIRSSKPIEDYLDPTDRDVFIALKTKAEELRRIANTPVPMTEIEKARLALKRAQDKLEQIEQAQTQSEKDGE